MTIPAFVALSPAEQAALDQLRAFGEKYARHCELFVREVLGAIPQPWQSEVMAAYDRGERRISIRSGHGVGKSTLLAWLMIHHLLFRFPQKTVVTAPTSTQLWDALWAEFKSWLSHLPPDLLGLLVVKQERVELAAAPQESFATARTSRAEQPEALQGIHAEHVLLLADEASGVPEQVFEAASGSMSGHNATTILTGNPVRGQGFFYETHHSLSKSWRTFHVPCSASPYVSADYIADMAERYGTESNAYRVRVLGEFPTADEDVIIPFELVEAARTRDVLMTASAPVIWGVDCARFGDDRSTLAKRRGNTLLERPKAWRKLDTMEVAGRIEQEYHVTPLPDRPQEIDVDVIGIGAGVVDRLRQLGLPVRGINVSETKSVSEERYANLRAELWFRARAWFARLDVNFAKAGDDLVKELTVTRFKFQKVSGKILAESKDELKERKALRGDSPDLADAFVLTFASTAMTALHGSKDSPSWKTPMRRNLKGIV